MLKIGLTGNIGSGKSFVCRIFDSLGVPVFYADQEAHKILNHPHTLPQLIKEFGVEIIKQDQQIDRKLLASIVFSKPEKLNALNSIIHPRLLTEFASWAQLHEDFKYIIMEAAILFENDFQKNVDKTVVVAAPLEIRLQRVVERDALDEKSVMQRMQNQLSDAHKELLADYLIINNGDEMLLPQIIKLHNLFNSLLI
jgi:dephospho-CoA kinase